MRVLFVAPTWMATGETAATMALAESIAAGGGEVWFLASGPAAQIIRPTFPDRVWQLTADLESNQALWRQTIADLKPNVVIFSELRSILFLRMNRQFPIANLAWVRELGQLDAALASIDHVGSTPAVEQLMTQLESRALLKFAASQWRPVLERMTSLLACPLHEPADVPGRRGIPYRSMGLPLQLDAGTRDRLRARYLGEEMKDEGLLIFHSVPRWSLGLTTAWKLPLYDFYSELLGHYLSGLPKPATIVSVNTGSLLRPSRSQSLRVVNLKGLPLADFDGLLLASDMLLTENVLSLTLAKTVGNSPGVVMCNSYTLDQIRERHGNDSPLLRIALDMERAAEGSVYPHDMYPFKRVEGGLAWPARRGRAGGARDRSIQIPENLIRLGRLPSSPFLKAELFGGDETRDLLMGLLCDPDRRRGVRVTDAAYIERLSRLEDGAAVVRRLLEGRTEGASVLGATESA